MSPSSCLDAPAPIDTICGETNSYLCGLMDTELCYFRFNDTSLNSNFPRVPVGCSNEPLPPHENSSLFHRIYELSDTCSECIEAGGKCEDISVRQFRRLRHPNLVTLYGCTSCQSHELILVYEHITNGTVADHLHGDRAITRSLTWPVRMSIAIETASALSYLHASDIIHRDVKTDNILLDNHFRVKVADFGLSRPFPLYDTHVTTAPQGTPGYFDPEYHQCYQLTEKSDVYSFGVVLVELISSLPAVDMGRHKNEINLSEYAMSRIHRGAFDEVIDPDLCLESNDKVRTMAISMAGLAFQCLQHNREFRPSMAEVLEALMRIESAASNESKIAHVELNSGVPASAKHPLTVSETDDVELIKNDQAPATPNCVIQKWDSKSTTSTSRTSS